MSLIRLTGPILWFTSESLIFSHLRYLKEIHFNHKNTILQLENGKGVSFIITSWDICLMSIIYKIFTIRRSGTVISFPKCVTRNVSYPGDVYLSHLCSRLCSRLLSACLKAASRPTFFFFFFNWDWLFWRMLAFPRDFSLQLTEMSFELHHRQLSFYCILWVVSVSVCSLVLFCFLFFRNVLKQFYALLLSYDWQCRLLITVFVPVIYVQS